MELFKTFKRTISMFLGKKAFVYFGAIILMAVTEALFSIISALLIQDIMDMAQTASFKGIEKLIFQNLLAGAVIIILWRRAALTYNNRAKEAGANISRMLCRKVISLPMTYYDNHHSAEFLSTLMYDSNKTGGIFGSRIRRLTMPILEVIAYLIPMFILSPEVTAGLLFISCIALLSNMLLVKPIEAASKQMSKANVGMTESITNILQGIEMIKIFPVRYVIAEKYDAVNQKCAEAMKKRQAYSALLACLNTVFDLLCSLAFLGIGVLFVQLGITNLAALTAIYILYGSFSYHFLQIAQYLPDLVSCLVNAKRVLDFIDLEEEPETYLPSAQFEAYPPADKEMPPLTTVFDQSIPPKESAGISGCGYVSIRDLTFSYDSGRRVLEHFNLDIEKGKCVAVTGASGRGKSTLAKLLLGFYKPEGGSIYIDGISTSRMGLKKLRDLIAYVPQEPYLYDVSIEQNIAYGKPGASREEIIAAARAANAHEFIMRQENGYDTVAGERGAKLSGGEKQRIAIARAIIKNAPILLLDEATSALDNESEYLVQEAVRNMMKDRTTIMIAHRPSTIATADIVVNLD